MNQSSPALFCDVWGTEPSAATPNQRMAYVEGPYSSSTSPLTQIDWAAGIYVVMLRSSYITNLFIILHWSKYAAYLTEHQTE